jgi:hypothetical protein
MLWLARQPMLFRLATTSTARSLMPPIVYSPGIFSAEKSLCSIFPSRWKTV